MASAALTSRPGRAVTAANESAKEHPINGIRGDDRHDVVQPLRRVNDSLDPFGVRAVAPSPDARFDVGSMVHERQES